MDRYECARDACVQFVGTLRVLRKPLAFRLPALNAELGSIAVQVRAMRRARELQEYVTEWTVTLCHII